jgi:3-oxoacyl-[acyl-carrier-protein] synthase-1
VVPCTVRAFTASCALGLGLEAIEAALRSGRSGLRPNALPEAPLDTWVGQVDGLDRVVLPDSWARDGDGRATRLAWLGLQHDGFIDAVEACRRQQGAARVGVIVGTSASTIAASEDAYRRLDASGGFPPDRRSPRLNTPHALAMFVSEALGLDGPALTVSTACSSSAKAFGAAARWLHLGVADAVVVGGIDALGASLLHGFRSLGLVSPEPCRPFDAARRGISLGEAAAYALLVRDAGGLRLLACGESNDAHHMSSPHPQGRGAELALDAALRAAGRDAADIDFVNLHGTASGPNDEVEAALTARRYRASAHACATKGLTGHTMGASGALEAVISLLALERGLCAGSGPTSQPDARFGPGFAQQWQARPRQRPVRTAASHSFGFGGTNAVLLFDRAAMPGGER